MFAVQVVVAIGIVLATVLVAAGRGDGLPAAVGRTRVRLPDDRPVVASDLEDITLGVGLRGYRMDEVDAVIDRLELELAQRDERIAELEREMAVSRPGDAPAVGAPGGAPTVGRAGGAPADG